jgi:hypothetical protein
MHEAGLEVHFWTINDPAQMLELLRLGADGLVTDRDRSVRLRLLTVFAVSDSRNKLPAWEQIRAALGCHW